MDRKSCAEPTLYVHRAGDPDFDCCACGDLSTPTDIFPNINIPVVSVAWQYTGLNPEELEGRLTTPYEKALTVLVDNIQHIESTTFAGQVIVKIYLQPGASLDTANSQVSAASEFQLRSLPPGILPPQIINFSASSVPIIQLGLVGRGVERAAAERSWVELCSAATCLGARRGDSEYLWRQAAVDHVEHRPEADAGQGAVAESMY